jgi:6-phosphogluconate dehydrogenase
VMGRNLVLNLVDNGFRVSVYNRTTRQERLLQGNSFIKPLMGVFIP